ncbi:MAG: hypothetical protein PVF15_01335 [Candidatus Bathyarchaeota archaeon]|jgi:hypothetical protein
MEVEITPTRKVVILGVDKRKLEDLTWCASTYGANRLYWIDGYLLCLEVYEKSFEHEIKTKEFPISQICYTKLPKQSKTFEVERGVKLPVVNVSEMRIFQNILKAILNADKENVASPPEES